MVRSNTLMVWSHFLELKKRFLGGWWVGTRQIYFMRLKAASRLLLPSCQAPLQIWSRCHHLQMGHSTWSHLRIGSIKVTSPLDWVNQGDITFRWGQPRWHPLQIGSTKVMSTSDWVNRGDITFRLGKQSWHHLQIGSAKVMSPSDWVNQGDVTFKLG